MTAGVPCKCGGHGVEHWPDGSTRHYIECDKCGRRTATHLASHGGSAMDEWLRQENPNLPLKPFGRDSIVTAHWHGKPMHMLRFATIIANMPGGGSALPK